MIAERDPPSAVSQAEVRYTALLKVLATPSRACFRIGIRASGSHDPSLSVFIAQIIALLTTGRLLGELMQRFGQPAVMGQLIAGILLGPAILGVLWPGLQHALFPASPEQKAMTDAVAQLGILLLLLLTGMETDLSVFRRSRHAALSVSIAGIAIPFACGLVLGELLPDSMLPDPQKRFITTLVLGTALSISSVKIVAMVVRELGFLRRTVGQVIVSAAIIDDTIGWIIISVTLGLAVHGQVDIAALGKTLLGAAVFLAFSFTLGRRLIFRLIRWANDHFVSGPGRHDDPCRNRSNGADHRRDRRPYRTRRLCRRYSGRAIADFDPPH
jgi:Kef-type K+ transport system membrane component KefB